MPNPRQQLDKDARRYIWHPFTPMTDWEAQQPLMISHGKGSFVFDVDGNAYLDGTSSIWVNLHGHQHPTLDHAIREQLKQIAHSTLLGLSHPPAIQLAKALVSLAPQGLERVFFSDNGSTAVEIAIKMAIQYWQQCSSPQPQKTQFIHLGLAYHGDTLGSMSLSGIELFRKPFASFLSKHYQVDPPYCYRCPLDLYFPQCRIACLSPLEQVLRQHQKHIAAIIVEPMVQGVAGLIPSPPGYLKRLHQLCQQFNVLLIADEVATGLGRTGRMFACEHESVTPDLMAIAKGLTGGYLPLAATLATDEIYSAFLGDPHENKTFFHGHSYTGNPLGCAAALANLSIFKTERTLAIMRRRTPKLSNFLKILCNNPWVGDIRQCGYMVGIELVQDQKTKMPFPVTDRIGHQVAMVARNLGLLIRPIGNIMILMPPLSASLQELKQMVDILRLAIEIVQAKK